MMIRHQRALAAYASGGLSVLAIINFVGGNWWGIAPAIMAILLMIYAWSR